MQVTCCSLLDVRIFLIVWSCEGVDAGLSNKGQFCHCMIDVSGFNVVISFISKIKVRDWNVICNEQNYTSFCLQSQAKTRLVFKSQKLDNPGLIYSMHPFYMTVS